MSTAPLPVWVTAALEGLKKDEENYATVENAVLALARRFTTDGVTPNKEFIETMRAVQEVDKLGAVIAGVIVLLEHPKGTQGMSKEDAMAHLNTYVTRLAAERTRAKVDRAMALLMEWSKTAGEVSLSPSELGEVLDTIPELAHLLGFPRTAGGGSSTQTHRAIDSDGNGRVSLQEIQTAAETAATRGRTGAGATLTRQEAADTEPAAATRDRTGAGATLTRQEAAEDAELVAKAAKTFLDNQDRNSTLYKAAEWEYNDEMPMNAASFLTTDEKIEYADAKKANPERFGAIKRALWDRQNAWPSNKPEPSTRPVLTTGAGDGGYALRPPSVLKF